ncbi:MAG: lipid-A-disaccharide synthase [Verrucomicrobia bacterium GWF2_62_7]|nr:MAG: lipid-A-disaccharide synthase [Verrucomicrobia bacterium GWF2_62_7]
MNAQREAPTIMMIAGEISGDNHAARVASEILRQRPGAKLFGAGGPAMKTAGVELLLDLTEHAVVGLTDVLANYAKFRRLFWQLVRAAEQRKPDAVILTDYPGFNLRFAKQMKAREIPVFYYISPQVWAWGRGRVKEIPKLVDLMMVVFPFEKGFYQEHAPELCVEFVGHPVVEQLGRERREVKREDNLVALLPGSREAEVKRILPPMLGAARLLRRERPDLQFELAAASDGIAAVARALVGNELVEVRVGNARDLMQRAAAGMVASGTATLECAFFGLPYVLVYRVSWLTYAVARWLVTVQHLGIVNVMAGREIVPEFIQHRARPELLAQAVAELLGDRARRERMQRELAEAMAMLEGERAAERAATAALAALDAASAGCCGPEI